jgi:hypothetical protein
MVIKEVLMMMRLMRVTRSSLADMREKRFYLERGLWVECTSGQSEDYLSHWGVYIEIQCLYYFGQMVHASCAAWSVRSDC